MNILFYRYGSICEPDLLEAFKKHGFNITEETSEIFYKNIIPSQRLNTLRPIIDSGNFSFIFSINFFPDISDICNIYHIPYISLVVDNPVTELYAPSMSNPYNRTFIFDRETYNRLKPVNENCIFHIPLATNPKRWNNVILANKDISFPEFEAPVSFVGSLYTEKNPFSSLSGLSPYTDGFLKGIMEAQLEVYGYNFIAELLTDDILKDIIKHIPAYYNLPEYTGKYYKEHISEFFIDAGITAMERTRLLSLVSQKFNTNLYTGSDTSSLPYIHNRGRVKTLTEMPLVFNRSTVNLNFTSRGIHSGIPLRIFDILGCHGFLLSSYQPEISEYFTIGEDLDIFESPDDMLDKISFYLSRPSLCREIAENGYTKVLKEHNWDLRTEQILAIAFGLDKE